MIYQFENDEIKKCIRCPMWVFPEMAMMPLCNLTGETIPKGSTPQENDCPLVAISKTETTSARSLSCWYCTEIEKHGVVTVKTVLDKSGRELDAYKTPYNYCPACGRKLD